MTRKLITFTGNNGAGAIAVAGVKAGDQILAVMFDTVEGIPAGQPNTFFAQFVLTNGHILQFGTADYSTYTFAALLERDVMLP